MENSTKKLILEYRDTCIRLLIEPPPISLTPKEWYELKCGLQEERLMHIEATEYEGELKVYGVRFRLMQT